MRNIFLIIRRHFNLLFFVFLQIFALYLLFSYNKFHESAWLEVAHEITGRVGGKYNNITYYFNLKKTNDELVKANESLRNQLTQQYKGPDTSVIAVTDTISYDSSGTLRKYIWRPAKVVNNTISLQNNTLTIERGENQGVRKDMGVISPSGVVGTVISTSGNYAIVMSMLNRQSAIRGKLKKTGETGRVFWDGIDAGYVLMDHVPKSVAVNVGDTIVTSNYSGLFPPNIMVGTIAQVVENKASNFYTLKLKTATNFYNVEHVMVVENKLKDEQKMLEAATKLNN